MTWKCGAVDEQIRTICHHPTLQWVAGVTKVDELEVWDLTRKDVLWRSTLRVIFCE